MLIQSNGKMDSYMLLKVVEFKQNISLYVSKWMQMNKVNFHLKKYVLIDQYVAQLTEIHC